jgi:alkaline phosphatase
VQRKSMRVAVTTIVVGMVVAGTTSATPMAPKAPNSSDIRNVIMLVGDGMSRSHVAAGRLRYYGAAGRLAMERLPVHGAVSTYAVEPKSDLPALVTESSSAATAWSSGVKTYNYAVGVDAYGRRVDTVMEQAHRAGYATGNVSTADVTDATPAAMYSHVLLRSCQGPTFSDRACLPNPDFFPPPEDKTLITPISKQIAQSATADVILGGGMSRFEPQDEDSLVSRGYQVLGDFGDATLPTQTSQSQRVATRHDLKSADGPKVVGLFTRGNMTVETAKAALPETAPQKAEPTLSEMTRTAISLLADRKHSPGFFLQVEGAGIDKRSHANDAGQTLGEVKAFDDAVVAALDFARRDRHTLVVVTADHESAGFSIIGKGSMTNAEVAGLPGNKDSSNPANDGFPKREQSANVPDTNRARGIANGPGAGGEDPKNFGPSTFRTPDDPTDVTDGSPKASLWLSYLSGDHTGADVPLYAYGPGAERFAGDQDNTALFRKFRRALFGSR